MEVLDPQKMVVNDVGNEMVHVQELHYQKVYTGSEL